MNNRPLFTVATITYNSSCWVRQAIESVLASSYTDFEYIISDDCSTDNTWDIIQGYKDPRIKAWRNESNIGEYPNRNKVLEHSRGQYLLYVDGDDILYKHTLRNLSEYILSFPEAGMIWGLNPQNFSFFVFPFLVNPSINLQLIYKTEIPISTIGFGEILFKTEVLREKGSFNKYYKIGDTYIKKKIALTEPVLYVNIGFMFWRQNPNQASKKVAMNRIASLLERVVIDNEIINDPSFPINGNEFNQIKGNLNISAVKLFVSSTLLRGKLISFFRYKKEFGFRFFDFFLLFKKGKYTYMPTADIGSPLFNKYNFTKDKTNALD